MKVKDMTQGNELKLVFLFSLPLMLGNIFQQLYIVCDTVIVSRHLGVNALGAIGCADWLNWMGLTVVTGFAQGFSIPVSHAFGMHHKESVKKNIAAMFLCCLVAVLVWIVGIYPFLETILKILNTPSEVLDLSLLYTRIITLGLVVTMFYNAFASILRAMGNSKMPLYAMLIASFFNVFLDVIFVMVFEWGIAGAAYATLIAQFLAGLYCLYHFMKLKEYRPTLFCREVSIYVQQIRLGVPLALQNVLISIGGMVLTRAVNMYGTLFLAGFTAMNKLYGLLEISAVSYGYAMVTYVGQNYGAGKYGRIRSGVKKMLGLSLVTALLISIVLYIFGPSFLSFFISKDSLGASEALRYGLCFLRSITIFLPILYILHLYRSTIQGLSDGLIPMVSGFFELLMRIGGALLLPIFFAKEGLYIVEVLAWIGAVLILVPAYYHKQKRFPGDVL